jgi:ABC-2 type transport system permease protein
MTAMLRIYQRLWQVNWAEQWQYRANLLMYLLYWMVSPIVYLAVWTSVANSQGSVGGLTANDFATYYLTLLLVDVLTSEITIHLMGYKVQDGSLSSELLKPIHPVFTQVLMNNLAFKALTLLVLVPVWGVLALLVRPDFGGVTLPNLLLAVPALLLGFGVSFVFGAAVTCVAFWTTRIYSLSEFYWAVAVLFSGQFVPLELMPPALRAIAEVLPFQLLKYFQIQLILGKLAPEEIVRGFALGLGWLVVGTVVLNLIWRAGLRRYSAVGA